MRLAVMQPYFFPYIGYFQLLYAVDTFVFYDDVNYIKGGWINRNKILLNGTAHLLTVPCNKISPNKCISEIEFDPNRKEFKKLIRTIEQAYKKAPYFSKVFPIITGVLETQTNKVSILAQQSIVRIASYLELKIDFKTSSIDFKETKGLNKADRLIEICKKINAEHYINPIGGIQLYRKDYFKQHEIALNFIRTKSHIKYNQGNNKEFIPWLSMIDVLMFNNKEEVLKMLTQYSFES